MSDITDKLRAARQRAWPSLVPVYDWALVIAAEMEYAADQASVLSQTHCSPAYPPAVELLAAVTWWLASPTTPDSFRVLAIGSCLAVIFAAPLIDDTGGHSHDL